MSSNKDEQEVIIPWANKLSQKTDVETIVLYLQGKVVNAELSPALEAKLERMNFCKDLLRQYASKLKVMPMMVREFKSKIPNYNRRTALRDIEETLEVFNTMVDTKHKGRDFWIDIILGFAFEDRTRAISRGDDKTALRATELMASMVEKFFGGHEAKLYEDIQPPIFHIGFYKELLKVKLPDNLDEQLKQFLVVKKKRQLGEDVRFVEMKKENGEGSKETTL